MDSKKLILIAFTSLGFLAHSASIGQGTRSPVITTEADNFDASVINGPLYIVNNYTVKNVEYSNLEFVNGPIYISYNSNLETVSFPKLLYVNGPIYVTYNGHLESVTYPQIRFVNGPTYFYANK